MNSIEIQIAAQIIEQGPVSAKEYDVSSEVISGSMTVS